MKHTFVILTALLAFCTVAWIPILAQQPKAGLKLEVVANNGTYVDVMVSVKATSTMGSPSTFGMATSSFMFSYNPNVISACTVQNVPGNFSNGSYAALNVTESFPGYMSIGTWLTGLPPTIVGPSWMEICTLRFSIPNTQGTTAFTWLDLTGFTDVYKYNSVGDVRLDIDFINATGVPLPMQLATFTGKYLDQSIRLDWMTTNEINSYRFNVERSVNGLDFNTIGFVPALGSSNYSYTDKDLANSFSEYWYRLKMMDRDGSSTYSSTVRVATGFIAATATLYSTYPNPFNPQATVHFMLPSEQAVTVALYDSRGREVMRLIDNEMLSGGYHTRTLNAEKLPSGEYILRMIAGSYQTSENIEIQK